MVTLTPFVTMLPGDQMTTYCTFDTSKDNKIVIWGETSADEMCAFLGVLPDHQQRFDRSLRIV